MDLGAALRGPDGEVSGRQPAAEDGHTSAHGCVGDPGGRTDRDAWVVAQVRHRRGQQRLACVRGDHDVLGAALRAVIQGQPGPSPAVECQ